MKRPSTHVGISAVGVVGALLVLTAGIVAWMSRPREEPTAAASEPARGPVFLSHRLLVARVMPFGDEEVAEPNEKDGTWGSVKGQIVLDVAAAPVPVPLAVTKDQNVCLLANGPLTSEDLVVDKKNLGVKNVFVWLIPTDPAKPLAIHPDLQKIKQKNVEVDQPCCMFVPHALCMRQGQVLVAKNPAPITHNFHYTGHPLSNLGNNSIIPAGGDLKIGDLVADKYPVKMSCDIHPWMNGWIRIFDHPYFALTDADGKFEIKNAPAGPCRIVTWHEAIGWVEGDKTGKPIDIPSGKTLDQGVTKMKSPDAPKE